MSNPEEFVEEGYLNEYFGLLEECESVDVNDCPEYFSKTFLDFELTHLSPLRSYLHLNSHSFLLYSNKVNDTVFHTNNKFYVLNCSQKHNELFLLNEKRNVSINCICNRILEFAIIYDRLVCYAKERRNIYVIDYNDNKIVQKIRLTRLVKEGSGIEVFSSLVMVLLSSNTLAVYNYLSKKSISVFKAKETVLKYCFLDASNILVVTKKCIYKYNIIVEESEVFIESKLTSHINVVQNYVVVTNNINVRLFDKRYLQIPALSINLNNNISDTYKIKLCTTKKVNDLIIIVVCTTENQLFLYRIMEEKLVSLPLSINNINFNVKNIFLDDNLRLFLVNNDNSFIYYNEIKFARTINQFKENVIIKRDNMEPLLINDDENYDLPNEINTNNVKYDYSNLAMPDIVDENMKKIKKKMKHDFWTGQKAEVDPLGDLLLDTVVDDDDDDDGLEEKKKRKLIEDEDEDDHDVKIINVKRKKKKRKRKKAKKKEQVSTVDPLSDILAVKNSFYNNEENIEKRSIEKEKDNNDDLSGIFDNDDERNIQPVIKDTEKNEKNEIIDPLGGLLFQDKNDDNENVDDDDEDDLFKFLQSIGNDSKDFE